MRRDLLTSPAPPPRDWQAVQLDPPTATEEAGPPGPVEGRSNQRHRLRRVDRRTRLVLAIAAAAALVVNIGAAWIYWRVTQSESPATGPAVDMALQARSDSNTALTPGRTGNLMVTLTNGYDFPIRITRVVPGEATARADDLHRAAGCDPTGVALSRAEFDVDWQIPRNTIGAFTIPDGLTMAPGARPECADATFKLPIRVSGTGQAH